MLPMAKCKQTAADLAFSGYRVDKYEFVFWHWWFQSSFCLTKLPILWHLLGDLKTENKF